MVIECSNCHKRYKVDESKIGPNGSKFKCKNCQTIISVSSKSIGKKRDDHSISSSNEEKEMADKEIKRIIVADDTQFFREMLSDVLSQSGYEVIVAKDGEETLQKVKHELPDLHLLLLDMLMPKIDGFKVIQELRRGVMGQKLPIFALSGVFKNDDDRQRMKELGVLGYIDKDTPPDEILRRVNMTLRPEDIE